MELVRFGRPDSLTTLTAAATASWTESPTVPEGATEKATITGNSYVLFGHKRVLMGVGHIDRASRGRLKMQALWVQSGTTGKGSRNVRCVIFLSYQSVTKKAEHGVANL
jgi:hypothetical protein